jgi:hypothetical protein
MAYSFTKQLAAAAANNICLAQNPGTASFTINGAKAGSKGLILTFGAITGGTGGSTPGVFPNVALTGGSGTGATANITVNAAGVVSAVAFVNQGTNYVANDSLAAASTKLGGVTGFSVLVGSVSTAIATLDTQRRVLITPGGNDSAISYVITGTDDSGQAIGETLAGTNATGVPTLLDYRTVTSIIGTASVANGITVGTNGVGATPWFEVKQPVVGPVNVECVGIVAAGKTVNWGVQYTYDNPYVPAPGGPAVPQAIAHPTLNNQTATLDGAINNAVAAIRFIVNSGTDAMRGVITPSGASGL